MPSCEVEKKVEDDVVMLCWQGTFKDGQRALNSIVSRTSNTKDFASMYIPEEGLQSPVHPDASLPMHSYETDKLLLVQM